MMPGTDLDVGPSPKAGSHVWTGALWRPTQLGYQAFEPAVKAGGQSIGV